MKMITQATLKSSLFAVLLGLGFSVGSSAEQDDPFLLHDYSEAIVVREVHLPSGERSGIEVAEWHGGEKEVQAFREWIRRHNLRLDKKRRIIGHLHSTWPAYRVGIYRQGKVVETFQITTPATVPLSKGDVSDKALMELLRLFPAKERRYLLLAKKKKGNSQNQ